MDEQITREEIRGIRVRFSIILGYLMLIYRTLTAFAFSLIILRRLTVVEYGIYSTILALLSLFGGVQGLWNFWIYRFYSRKRMEVVSAGHGISLLYSVGAAAFMFALSLYWINLDLITSILASILVFSMNYRLFYNMLVVSVRPYYVSYADFTWETIRVILAYILVAMLRLRLIGVFTALITATVLWYIPAITGIFRAKARVPRVRWSLLVKHLPLYLKNIYIPLVRSVENQLRTSAERILALLVTDSYVLPAYLGVAYISRGFVLGGLRSLTRPLSSRLLRLPLRSDIEDALRIALVVNTFMAGSLILYSKVMLSLLNPVYIDLYPIFSLYAALFLVSSFSFFFSNIGITLETADLRESGLGLRKTYLFKNPLLSLMAGITYLSIGTGMLAYIYYTTGNPALSILPYPIAAIAAYTAIMPIYYKRSIEKIKYKFPWRELYAALAGLTVISVFSVSTGLVNYRVTSVWSSLPTLTLILVSVTIMYFTTVLVISPWSRKIVREGIEMITSKTSETQSTS